MKNKLSESTLLELGFEKDDKGYWKRDALNMFFHSNHSITLSEFINNIAHQKKN